MMCDSELVVHLIPFYFHKINKFSGEAQLCHCRNDLEPTPIPQNYGGLTLSFFVRI